MVAPSSDLISRAVPKYETVCMDTSAAITSNLISATQVLSPPGSVIRFVELVMVTTPGAIPSTVAVSDRFAYSMTKGAVRAMTFSVAQDYIKHNIRCNCISPGRIHTPFVDGFIKKNYPGKEKEMFEKLCKTHPIGRMGQPREVAGLALFLCSDEAAFATGTDYPFDGGYIRLKND